MQCAICGCEDVDVIYDGLIRDGRFGNWTKEKYKMYKCQNCETIWHDGLKNESKEYYETTAYRESIGDKQLVEDFYKAHDADVINKLNYIGTGGLRGKVVSDIGCGGGSLLDFISGVADSTVAIEPSMVYREAMKKRGHDTYAYVEDAINAGVKADVALSFDVVEHVDDPISFMKGIYDLLKEDGIAIIGTPSDAPVLRKICGEYFEKFYFRYAHPWIFSKKSFEMICKRAGFKEVEVKTTQLYGISNLINWVDNKKPMGDLRCDAIPKELEDIYRIVIEKNDLGDVIIAHLRK